MKSGVTDESAGLPFSLKALMLRQGPSGHNKPFLLEAEGAIWDDPGGIYTPFEGFHMFFPLSSGNSVLLTVSPHFPLYLLTGRPCRGRTS